MSVCRIVSMLKRDLCRCAVSVRPPVCPSRSSYPHTFFTVK